INFPLISDLERKLSADLGILAPGGVTYRAAYLVDKSGTVRSMVINDLPLGRNVAELLRTLDALQYHEQHGEVCPAGWPKGQRGIQTTRESAGSHLEKKHGQSAA